MKHNNSAMAKKQAIKNYHYYCIMTGQLGGVVGCHIFAAGSNYDLACYDENIVPLIPRLHTTHDDTLDWIVFDKKPRSPIERIIYLLDHVSGEYKNQLIRQLYDLVKVMSLIPRHENNAEIILTLLGTYE